MSTYCFIHCSDCKQDSGDANHAADFMATCLAAEPRLSELFALINDFELSLRSEYRNIDGPHPLLFVSEHKGHHLTVMDEYGYAYDAKGERLERSEAP